MEHAQRVNQLKFNSNMKNVLILILMEHAQRVMPINSLVSILKVLS